MSADTLATCSQVAYVPLARRMAKQIMAMAENRKRIAMMSRSRSSDDVPTTIRIEAIPPNHILAASRCIP